MNQAFPWPENQPDKAADRIVEAELPPEEYYAAHLLERKGAASCATWLALGSWLPSLGVIVGGPLLVFFHFALLHLQLQLWWISFVALIIVALMVVIAALQTIPEETAGVSRFGALACTSVGFVLLVFAVIVTIGSAVILVPLNRMKAKFAAAPPAVAPPAAPALTPDQVKKRNAKRQELALLQQQADAQRKKLDTLQRKLNDIENAREIAQQRRRQENLARQRAAVAAEAEALKTSQLALQAADKPGSYRTALFERLTKTDAPPIPEYAGEEGEKNTNLSLDFTRNKKKTLVFFDPPVKSDSLLIDGSLKQEGLLIRRLSLEAESFAPTAVRMQIDDKEYKGDGVYLLQRGGKVLQIDLPDWRLRQTQELGSSGCSLLVRDRYYVFVLTSDKLIRLDGFAVPLIAAQQLTVDEQGNFEVSTGGSHPLLAQWKKKELISIREVSRIATLNDGNFQPTQLGRTFAVSRNGKFYVAWQNGVFLGESTVSALPKPNAGPLGDQPYLRWIYSGQVGLTGSEIITPRERWPINSVRWQKLLPAEGIDVEKFAQLSDDRLATCNADNNLLIYDTRGELISSHTWPNVGKTTAIVPLPHSEMVLVFTEKRIFVVSPLSSDNSAAEKSAAEKSE